MRRGRAEDAPGRAADVAVARVEARGGAVIEVAQHDLHREHGTGQPCAGDREPGPAAVPRERVPEPVARDDECDLLLAERGRDRGEREGDEPILVQVPEGIEEQRRRERDRVELVQGQPSTAGRSRYTSANPSAARSEPRCSPRARTPTGPPSATAAACPASSRCGLGHSHQSGAKTARIGSKCAPSREIWSPCRLVISSGCPCAVVHTAWTMLPRSNRAVSKARSLQDRERPEPGCKRGAPACDEPRGTRHRLAAARSSSDRQRTPRTSSEACASKTLAPRARHPLGQRVVGRQASHPPPCFFFFFFLCVLG